MRFEQIVLPSRTLVKYSCPAVPLCPPSCSHGIHISSVGMVFQQKVNTRYGTGSWEEARATLVGIAAPGLPFRDPTGRLDQ